METLLKQFQKAVENNEIKMLVAYEYEGYIKLYLQDNNTKEQYLYTISLS